MAKVAGTTKDPNVSVYNDLEDEVDIVMTVSGEFDSDSDDEIDRLIDQVQGQGIRESAGDDDDDDDDAEPWADDADDPIPPIDINYAEVHDEPNIINSDVNDEIMAERDVFYGPDEDGELIEIIDATVEPEDGPDDGDDNSEDSDEDDDDDDDDSLEDDDLPSNDIDDEITNTDLEDDDDEDETSVNEGFNDTGEGCVTATATRVMATYQNANKWLDILKEYLFSKLGCVYFASYIHNLAHTMPARFDKFGDILHTINMEIPYPATAGIPKRPEDVKDVIDMTFDILKSIQEALNAFIECTDKSHHGMACAAETLLNDIESEFTPLYRINDAWDEYQDNMRFDKWVGQYVEKRKSLAESTEFKGKYFDDNF